MPRLDYDAARVPEAYAEHRELVGTLKRQLLRMGYVAVSRPIPVTGTAHACGTLVAGRSPQDSAVDRHGRVHGLANIYVADGSVLPRVSRVNPALTIYAWGLRLASHLAGNRSAAGGADEDLPDKAARRHDGAMATAE
jgi:choline dehydrogenase-like flavoprotein